MKTITINQTGEPPLAHSINDVVRVTGIGRSSIYEEIGQGRLKARKLGRKTIILDTDLRDWLASLPAMKGAA